MLEHQNVSLENSNHTSRFGTTKHKLARIVPGSPFNVRSTIRGCRLCYSRQQILKQLCARYNINAWPAQILPGSPVYVRPARSIISGCRLIMSQADCQATLRTFAAVMEAALPSSDESAAAVVPVVTLVVQSGSIIVRGLVQALLGISPMTKVSRDGLSAAFS